MCVCGSWASLVQKLRFATLECGLAGLKPKPYTLNHKLHALFHRRDDSFYNTNFKTNLQIDAEGRPMMELLTRNKYADNHSSFFIPEHLAQWSPGFNHTMNANQQNISRAQYYRCPPEHRQLIKADDFDPVFHQPLIRSLIEPVLSFTPQEILDREARFSREMNPYAVRLSSQMCTIPTTPFDFYRSMTVTHAPAVARQRPTTGTATRPGTAPPRTPSASILNASSMTHPNLMIPKTRGAPRSIGLQCASREGEGESGAGGWRRRAGNRSLGDSQGV